MRLLYSAAVIFPVSCTFAVHLLYSALLCSAVCVCVSVCLLPMVPIVLIFFGVLGVCCSVADVCFALRSARVPVSPSPNELLQLVATTDAHVVCVVSVSVVVPPL